MKTSKSLALLSTIVVAFALTACGGGGGGGDAGSGSAITTISVSGMVKFMTDIMSMSSDATSPNDISTTQLAVDETSEPGAI